MVNKRIGTTGTESPVDPNDPASVRTTDPRPEPPDQDPEKGKRLGIIGTRGLGIFNGFLNEEWQRELRTWGQEVRLYLEMRDDPTVSTLLSALKLPLLGADWHIEPSDPDNAGDVDAAMFLENNMNGMKEQTWRAYVEQAIEIMDFGWAVNEIVMEKRDDGFIWISNLEPRGQETLRRWGVRQDEPDQVTHMVQGPFRTGIPISTINLPLWKCVHLIWQGRKGNPQGKALLRSLYVSYRFLKHLRVFEGIGIERDAAGVPIYTLPPGAGTMSDSDIDDTEDSLRGLKADESEYVIIPHGTELKPFGSTSKAYDVRRSIEAYEKQILMRGFAQFLALGTTSVGTQALVEGQTDFFTMGLRAFQNVIVEQLNQQLVPYLFMFNSNQFPGMSEELPTITWDPPQATDIAALIEVYNRSVQAGLITPLRVDEVSMRARLNLPELPEDEGHERRVPGAPGGDDSIPESPFRSVHKGIAFDQAAGQDLRTIPGVYEKFVNQYQKDLVAVYDTWSTETARLMSLPDVTQGRAMITLDRRIQELAIDLKMLGRQRISEASGLGLGEVLGKRASSPEVVSTVARIIEQNDQFIDGSLIPSIRERFNKDALTISRLPEIERQAATLETLATRRSAVARGAGGAQVVIFDVQLAAGKAENNARRMAGEKPIAVRWRLDPSAKHCEDDPNRGTFGCPSLAKVYSDGWNELPTVPAGNVSCLGNCRCSLEADFEGDGNWQRIT